MVDITAVGYECSGYCALAGKFVVVYELRAETISGKRVRTSYTDEEYENELSAGLASRSDARIVERALRDMGYETE